MSTTAQIKIRQSAPWLGLMPLSSCAPPQGCFKWPVLACFQHLEALLVKDKWRNLGNCFQLSPLSQQNQYAGMTSHKSQLKITLDASRYVIFLSQLARKNSNLLLHENQLSVRAVRLKMETECNKLTILSDIRLCQDYMLHQTH